MVKVDRNSAELDFKDPRYCLETVPGPSVTNSCQYAVMWSLMPRKSKQAQCFRRVMCSTELHVVIDRVIIMAVWCELSSRHTQTGFSILETEQFCLDCGVNASVN